MCFFLITVLSLQPSSSVQRKEDSTGTTDATACKHNLKQKNKAYSSYTICACSVKHIYTVV